MNNQSQRSGKGVPKRLPPGRMWERKLETFKFTDEQFAIVLDAFDDGAFIFPDPENWRREFEMQLSDWISYLKMKPVGPRFRGRPSNPRAQRRNVTSCCAKLYKQATGLDASGSGASSSGGPFCRFTRTIFEIIEPNRPAPSPRSIVRHLAQIKRG